MNRLCRVEIRGFKSIRGMELDLGPLNILIGANGSGKSNLISYFKLLNFMNTGTLQEFVGREGGGNALLHYGSAVSPQMLCTLHFETPAGANTYHHRLVHAAPATLIFADERTVSHTGGRVEEVILGSGHRESLLPRRAEDGDRTARVIHHLLGGCRVFQFHDTSERANIRQEGYIEDNRYLRHDAGNLAAFLRALRETNPDYYRRIIVTIQQIAPFFRDFDLEPSRMNPRQILLNWRERESDFLFGPHQLSDGTLRTMALITLLLQPEDDLPDVILLDEPELGLHPSAIQLLASLLRAVSSRRQVIAATQSATLVDQFDPEDVVVVERGDSGSIFRRLSSEALRDWLDQYALGELWQKNVIGGRP
jgi:predicted ATPase